MTRKPLIGGILANLPLLRQAEPSHIAELARQARMIDIRRGDVLCRFQAGDQQLRVRLASDATESIYTAKCPSYNLEPRIPCVVRRAVGIGSHAELGATE